MMYIHEFSGNVIDESTVCQSRSTTTSNRGGIVAREVMAVLDFFSSTGLMVKASVLAPLLDERPVELPLGEVIRGAGEVGFVSIRARNGSGTHHHSYGFRKDEDDYFWVQHVSLPRSRQQGQRVALYYRADQLTGLRSLLEHLVGASAD